jgi:hypothetical protein
MWKEGDIIYSSKYIDRNITINKRYIVISYYISSGWEYIKIIGDDGTITSYFPWRFTLDHLAIRKQKIEKIKEKINASRG